MPSQRCLLSVVLVLVLLVLLALVVLYVLVSVVVVVVEVAEIPFFRSKIGAYVFSRNVVSNRVTWSRGVGVRSVVGG